MGGVEGEGEEEGVDVNVVVDAFRGLKKKFHLIFTFSGAKNATLSNDISFSDILSRSKPFSKIFALFETISVQMSEGFFESFFFLFSPFLKLKCQLRETRATIFKLNLSFQIF